MVEVDVMTAGYTALREGAAVIHLTGRGLIRVRGEDRVRLLHAMCTNHVEQLRPGENCYAFFLNAQGRILSDSHILCRPDHLLLDTEPESHETLYEHLDRFIIADDVTIEDARTDLYVVAVEGPRSDEIFALVKKAVQDCLVERLSTTGAPGYRIYLPSEKRPEILAAIQTAGARSASPEEQKIVRLENFHPRFGDDITSRHLVQETQMLEAVHFSKGCYLGQEIVERIRSRGQVHRLLVPIYIAAMDPPQPGTLVMAEETKAGETMSAAYSPALGKVVAFAYIRAEHARPGTALTAGNASAEVAAARPA
jgi:aminomethyltransferase